MDVSKMLEEARKQMERVKKRGGLINEDGTKARNQQVPFFDLTNT